MKIEVSVVCVATHIESNLRLCGYRISKKNSKDFIVNLCLIIDAKIYFSFPEGDCIGSVLLFGCCLTVALERPRYPTIDLPT